MRQRDRVIADKKSLVATCSCCSLEHGTILIETFPIDDELFWIQFVGEARLRHGFWSLLSDRFFNAYRAFVGRPFDTDFTMSEEDGRKLAAWLNSRCESRAAKRLNAKKVSQDA